MGNQTRVTEFILLGFPNLWGLQVLLFIVLLLTYVLTVTGNLVILLLILSDQRLRTHMYFFLGNLSFLELVLTTVIIPKLLSGILAGRVHISFASCMTQSYIYFLLGTTDFFLLAVMSFDRYQAICNPLRYEAIMSSKVCTQLVLGSWIGGFLCVLFPTVTLTRLTFCGPNTIDHFFCDSWPLLQLSCSDTRLLERVDFVLSSFVLLSSLAFTTVSYTYIISTILRIPSSSERRRAFSTCSSHLTVVVMVYGSSIFLYVRPSWGKSLLLNKMAATLSCIVTPLLNPFIFSLRNDKVKEVLQDAFRQHKVKFSQRV
ncbi:olfactory receptor 6T1-like [Trachemys scripta elegans]|uniref:olfactory receptor 6T1-like n=1 Tax=Trachemys scripta elegans TaxID=31138 RepID=UPI001551D2D0|nr:olfactory receptor 6T1-like [Trachemys scripta elegans]